MIKDKENQFFRCLSHLIFRYVFNYKKWLTTYNRESFKLAPSLNKECTVCFNLKVWPDVVIMVVVLIPLWPSERDCGERALLQTEKLPDGYCWLVLVHSLNISAVIVYLSLYRRASAGPVKSDDCGLSQWRLWGVWTKCMEYVSMLLVRRQDWRHRGCFNTEPSESA